VAAYVGNKLFFYAPALINLLIFTALVWWPSMPEDVVQAGPRDYIPGEGFGRAPLEASAPGLASRPRGFGRR
jgi:hypothetical protein